MANIHRFGRCELRVAERELCIDGQPVALGARAFDLLLALIEQPNRVVGKNELLERVWYGRLVEEGNIAVHIAALRKVLGAKSIATIPGRGYQFAAVLESAPATPLSAAPVAPRLYGRDPDIERACELLEMHALVSIVGPRRASARPGSPRLLSIGCAITSRTVCTSSTSLRSQSGTSSPAR